MPTVIDQLIITLGLDPTAFTEGQRETAQTLLQLQRQASRTSQDISDNLSAGINRLFSAVHNPLQFITQHFQSISIEAQQSGSAVAHAAGVGAGGIAALSAAGLAAIGVFKALHGVVEAATTTMASSAAVGRLAAFMGGPGQQTPLFGAPGVAPMLSRFALAAQRTTLANPEETLANIQQLQQDLVNLQTKGEYSERLRSLSFLGVTDINRYGPQDVMRLLNEVAQRIQGMDPARAQSYLGGVLNRQLIQFLQTGPETRRSALAQANQVALTDQQIFALTREQLALTRLNQAWQGLVRHLEADLAPAITNIIEKFERWLVQLQQNPEALDRIKVGLEAVAAVFGVTLVSAIAKAVIAINSFWALPLIRFLTSAGGLGFLAGLYAFLNPTEANKGENEFMKQHPELFPNYLPPEGYGEGEPDRRNWWERNMPEVFGGKPPPPSRYRVPEGGERVPMGGDPRHLEGFLRETAVKYGVDPDRLVAVAKSEGLGQFVGDQGTSFGALQAHIGGGLGDLFQQTHPGVDITDPRNERTLLDWQIAHLRDLGGWQPYHGAARIGITGFQGIGQLPIAAPIVQQQTPVDTQRQPISAPSIAVSVPPPPSAIPQYSYGLGMVRGAQASTTNNTTSINNPRDTDVNIGNINVTSPTGNPYQTGGAIADSIRRSLLTSQANTGLE